MFKSINFILIICCLNIYSVCSQIEPLFQTTVYFEDGIGNKDSIEVGYDYDANNNYNPSYGEEDIRTSFDSIFEVRGMHYFDKKDDAVLSKRIITRSETSFTFANGSVDSTCQIGSRVLFLVNIENQPLKITINKHDFLTDKCRAGSYMTPDVFSDLGPNWWEFENAQYGCLGAENKFEFILDKDAFVGETLWYERKVELENDSLETYYGITFNFKRSHSPDQFEPCPDIRVSTIAPIDLNLDFQISPNPVRNFLRVKTDLLDEAYVQIYSVGGKKVFSRDSSNLSSIDVSDLSPGVYFVRLYGDGFSGLRKMVKM